MVVVFVLFCVEAVVWGVLVSVLGRREHRVEDPLHRVDRHRVPKHLGEFGVCCGRHQGLGSVGESLQPKEFVKR